MDTLTEAGISPCDPPCHTFLANDWLPVNENNLKEHLGEACARSVLGCTAFDYILEIIVLILQG